MNKDELIGLHNALTVFKDEMEDRLGREIEAEEYEEHGVSPIEAHKTKAKHEKAIVALGPALQRAAEEEKIEA